MKDQNFHADEDALRKRVAVWLRRKGDSGSPESVREAIENVTGVFKILQEWESAEKPESSEGSTVRLP